jgi:DNA mismatch repair protein MutL
VAFVLVRDERVALQLPAVGSLRDRIRDLHGADLVEKLLEVQAKRTRAAIEISGLIGQAGLSRSTRGQQLVFVNGRAIESPVLSAALREGYHTALMKGQFPVTFLFLQMDPAAVDVNVHPAKREVRFRDPASVREAVVAAVQATLESGREAWQQQFSAPAPTERENSGSAGSPAASPVAIVSPSTSADTDGSLAFDVTSMTRQPFDPSATTSAAAPPDFHRGNSAGAAPNDEFQIIGVLNKLYVLMENANGLVLVDQHAAHERILFEELRRRMEEKGVPSQRLLLSQIFDLSPRDAEWVERNLAALQKMGIGIEPFGAQTFKIDSLPTFLHATDAAAFVRDVVDGLRTMSNSSSALRLGEDMIAKTVCRHAVKANDPLRYPEVQRLIRDLLACELPYCCPHGRPTMIQISLGELEKKFGRKV